MAPFWTSQLLRYYAWILILGAKGIPSWLAVIGIPDLRIINTPWAVLIGAVYGFLPLMVPPIYVSLEKLDKRLLEASADLGWFDDERRELAFCNCSILASLSVTSRSMPR